MALVVKSIYRFDQFFDEYRDRRLENWFLIGSPVQPLILIASFLYFVNILGPKIMANRKPYELRNIMIIYNLFQMISNFALACAAIYYIGPRYKLKCMPLDLSDSPDAMMELKLCYCYYMLKVLDLLDTVFFVLRKKYNQMSFLHIYHHALMTAAGYILCNFAPGGHAVALGVVNLLVHTVMYFYYFMTCINSKFKSALWKKHITHMQLIQFACMTVHFAHPLLFGNCAYPKIWSFAAMCQNAFMLVLFSDFYYKAYIKKPTKRILNKLKIN